jgi:DNA-binding IclR family transcriptional regulator
MSLVLEVLALVEETGGVVDLGQLSRETGIQASALLGMLDLCVRKGYLEAEQEKPAIACTSCASEHSCVLACPARAAPGGEKASRRPLVYRLRRGGGV